MIKVDSNKVKLRYAEVVRDDDTYAIKRARKGGKRLWLFLDNADRLCDGRIDFEPLLRDEMARAGFDAGETDIVIDRNRDSLERTMR